MKTTAEDVGSGRDPVRSKASARETRAAVDPADPTKHLNARIARGLQRSAGNRAVSRLVAQRRSSTNVQRLDAGGGGRGGPAADPKFAALKHDLQDKQKLLTAHPPAKAEAVAAAAAAKPPQDDKEAQGKAANAEKMDAAKPGEFNKAAFVKAVNDAINAQAPKNLDEADKFGESGKASAVKEQVSGQVADGKKASAGPVESATKAPPDTSQAKEKPVTPLTPDKPPAVAATVDAAKAVPDKAPPEATDLSAGPKQVNNQMAEAQVTEEQLAKSNEPEFGDAMNAKKEGEQHSAAAPATMRAAEAQTLAGAKAQAGQEGTAALTAMTGDRKQSGAALASGKTEAKGSDETRRAEATAKLQKVFDATKKDVEDILTGLDKKVDDAFTSGEKAARDAFTAEHKRRMDEYKDKRYSGLIGAGRWIKDKFAGLPEEANQIFVQARSGYTNRMQQVISGVADIIGAELGRAKKRIADGRTQLQAEVAALPKDLQAAGKAAAADFAGKFDELTESVNSKGQELVQTLATKYKEALSAVDEEIAAEKEKNKGLIDKAIDAVGGVIRTILQLKDMLLGVLAKAAQAVMAIIKDPIGFLGNLVSAVGAGLRAFMGNIGEHLKKGLVGWLMGAMSGAGLELPAKFDLRGILGMIASLLGLTWAAIRARIIKAGIPERAMSAVEAGVSLVQKVQAQGIAGIWEEIKEKVGDLKENLFSKISEYLIPTVLMAGITWVISLLNPASAFIKACKMIVDIVMFIVQRGAQIIEFVNAVLDAIIAIAGGGSGGVPGLIEKALARSIPVLIGALAAILGVGGIAEKVKKLFQAMSKPVMKAVDWVVGKIVNLGKKIWAKLKGKFGKTKERTLEQKSRDLSAGLAAADKLATRGLALDEISDKLPAIRTKYHMTSLELAVDQRSETQAAIHFVGTVNPKGDSPKRNIPTKPVAVAIGDKVQVRDGGGWAMCEVTKFTTTHFEFVGHSRSGRISGTMSLAGVGQSWRKWRPEMSYKTGEAFEAIRNLSLWTNFADARQVLSYRAHGGFNVPPGKNWHHIHENKAGGAHSVKNLALSTAGQNQDFNVWFSRPQRGTGALSLREFLRGQDKGIHEQWGLECIAKHGFSVVPRDQGRGLYQEIV